MCVPECVCVCVFMGHVTVCVCVLSHVQKETLTAGTSVEKQASDCIPTAVNKRCRPK